MSKNAVENTIYNYLIDFTVGGEVILPTSATITITDNAGNVVESIEDVTITLPGTAGSVIYPIPAAVNTLSLVNELRYITITFIYQGKTYYINDFYTIRSSVKIPVTYDSVRKWLSFTAEELPDEDIDIYFAYDIVNSDLNTLGVNLGNIITTGSVLLPYAQQAISLRAAIDSAGELQLSFYQSEQADNTIYKRFANIDFDKIIDRLLARYSQLISTLVGDTGINSTAATIFIVQTGVDPVTGE